MTRERVAEAWPHRRPPVRARFEMFSSGGEREGSRGASLQSNRI
jgi:hypothetical protein